MIRRLGRGRRLGRLAHGSEWTRERRTMLRIGGYVERLTFDRHGRDSRIVREAVELLPLGGVGCPERHTSHET